MIKDKITINGVQLDGYITSMNFQMDYSIEKIMIEISNCDLKQVAQLYRNVFGTGTGFQNMDNTNTDYDRAMKPIKGN